MEARKTYSVKEKLILEIALKMMLSRDFDSVDISSVSKHSRLDTSRLEELYECDDGLRMAAMEYAALQWLSYIKKELASLQDSRSKLLKLLRFYVAGSESHPESLSLYIDLWKKIRDLKLGDGAFLKSELNKIYNYYVDAFIGLLEEEIGIDTRYNSYIKQMAWIIVVISDGFHVQSLIQHPPPDFNAVAATMFSMCQHLLYKE